MASATVSLSMMSVTASTSSCENAAARRCASGSDVIGLPPITSNARTRPDSISSASAARGSLAVARRQVGAARRARGTGERSGRSGPRAGRTEVEPRKRAGVEPRATGLFEGPRDDLDRPRQPLGDVGFGGHRAAGAGHHRHRSRATDGVDERVEIVDRQTRCAPRLGRRSTARPPTRSASRPSM